MRVSVVRIVRLFFKHYFYFYCHRYRILPNTMWRALARIRVERNNNIATNKACALKKTKKNRNETKLARRSITYYPQRPYRERSVCVEQIIKSFFFCSADVLSSLAQTVPRIRDIMLYLYTY